MTFLIGGFIVVRLQRFWLGLWTRLDWRSNLLSRDNHWWSLWRNKLDWCSNLLIGYNHWWSLWRHRLDRCDTRRGFLRRW